jgi:hypothetical protein
MKFPKSLLGFLRRGHFHLPRAQRLSCRICDDPCGTYSPKGGEEIFQVLSGEGRGQSVDPQFSAQGILLCVQFGRSDNQACRTQHQASQPQLGHVSGLNVVTSLRPLTFRRIWQCRWEFLWRFPAGMTEWDPLYWEPVTLNSLLEFSRC